MLTISFFSGVMRPDSSHVRNRVCWGSLFAYLVLHSSKAPPPFICISKIHAVTLLVFITKYITVWIIRVEVLVTVSRRIRCQVSLFPDSLWLSERRCYVTPTYERLSPRNVMFDHTSNGNYCPRMTRTALTLTTWEEAQISGQTFGRNTDPVKNVSPLH